MLSWPDPILVAGLLLVIGPVVGLIPVGNPSLIPVWSASREDHLAIIGAHRLAWAWLNAGFVFATVATAGGLAVVALAFDALPGPRGALVASAIAYAFGGSLWCAVLAIRARTTPTLADLVATGRPTEPAESLLGAAVGGLFGAFVLLVSGALVALGVALLATGGVAPIVAAIAIVAGLLLAGIQLATGDVVPAVLYLPTLLVGIALLVGWT